MIRKEKAITLIALIITIIILVILAAVSIRAAYNMGIVNHAVNGTQAYAEETKREKELFNQTESSIENMIAKIKEQKSNEMKEYSIGDYVTINGEGFYVIEDSPASQTAVKLLAEKNVDTSTNKQSDNLNAVLFDTSTPVYENSSIKTLVDLYVSQLGVEVIEKRLITLNDLHTLGLGDETAGTPIDCPSFVNGFYWLMDVLDDMYVWTVAESEGFGYTDAFLPNSPNYGMRPVIEILKNSITN